MSNCVVIDLTTNKAVNYIVADITDAIADGFKLVEIPNGSFWSDSAEQVLLRTQYWDGTKVQDIPTGYYWDGTLLQLMAIE